MKGGARAEGGERWVDKEKAEGRWRYIGINLGYAVVRVSLSPESGGSLTSLPSTTYDTAGTGKTQVLFCPFLPPS